MQNEILHIDYKDFLLNQKRIPDKESSEADSFFQFHKRLALEGCYVDGIFFNPFLYWHLNLWHTEVDVIDEKGYISQKYKNPTFRDNEWLTTNAITEANKQRKGLAIGGIRRFSKSVQEASYIAWGATFDENSQNIISGLNAPDIKLITDKIDKGLNFLPWYYKWDRIEDNWKNQVTLGIKSKGGERLPFSSILIRNLDEGNNEEAIAGTKPRKLIIDEGGKGSFLRGLQAAIPGFTTQFGWACSPIVTFTGGDMKKFFDAKQLMFDVAAFNFLEFKNEDNDKRVHGLFIGHKYRLEAKEESTFGNFINAPKESQLHEIRMQVGNPELADKVTDENLERARKANDRVAFLKERMYYPKKVDDIFLNEDSNIFKIEDAKKQQNKLLTTEPASWFVNLFLNDEGKVEWEQSKKRPIESFPHKPSDDLDAPVVIYEHPIDNAPRGLYIAGVDSYRQGKAKYSSSLGTVYIYKRIHSISGEEYQDMFVASYAARPDNKDVWENQARLLCKYYNALVLCENDEISFIEYMKAKGDAHMLIKMGEVTWLKDAVAATTVSREYGIHRSSEKIRDYLHSSLKKYLESTVYTETDENGSVIKEVLGVSKIFDPVLLEEIIQFNEDINVDRIIAAELAIAQANIMDPIVGKVQMRNEDMNGIYRKPNNTPIFRSRKTSFRKSNLFRK